MHSSMNRVFEITLTIVLLLGITGCKTSAPSTSTSDNKQADSAASKSAASSACYNAYYPATATIKKTYKITYSGGMPPATYSESYSNLSSDGFTQKLEFAETNAKSKAGASNAVTVEGGVKCRQDGLAFMEYGNLSAGQNLKYKYKTLNANGVSFPNENEWQVGKKWQMVYDVEGQMTDAPIEAMKMSPKGTITLNCEILGKESVTVATGTYDAFKVAMNFTSNMKMNVMGREMPINMSFKSNVWFAKDVGMIKNSSDEFKAVTELVAFTK